MKNIVKYLFATLLCCTLTGCMTDVKFSDINTDINGGTALALPIGSVRANMTDLLDLVDSTYIVSDSTNAICILYSQNDIALNLEFDKIEKSESLIDTIKLRNKDCFYEILNSLPANVNSTTLEKGSYKFREESTYEFTFDEAEEGVKKIRIDSAIIANATLDLGVDIYGCELSESNYLIMSLEYPEVLDERYADEFRNIKITANQYSLKKELEHLRLYFTEIMGDGPIDLAVNFEIVSDGTLTITREADIQFNMKVNIENSEALFGYFWMKDPITSDKLSYDIPREIIENELLKNSNLLFSNPILELNATTNIGIPLALDVHNIYAVKNGEEYHATFNDNSSLKVEFNRPAQPYDSASTKLILNRDNGSLHTLLSVLPEQINIDYSVSTVYQEESESWHFLTMPIEANVDVMAMVPLQFDPTSNFVYNDTIDADLSSLVEDGTLENIEIDTVDLYLDIANRLPVNTNLKLVYLDENDQIITESKIFKITSAEVDVEGRVTNATNETIVLSTNGESINDVLNTKKIILALSLESRDNDSRIYFQTTDAIEIKLSAFIKMKVSISEEEDIE